MKIERTRDKVVISEAELQQIICDHIHRETGRHVADGVRFQLEPGSEKRATAYCWLLDKPEPQVVKIPARNANMPADWFDSCKPESEK